MEHLDKLAVWSFLIGHGIYSLLIIGGFVWVLRLMKKRRVTDPDRRRSVYFIIASLFLTIGSMTYLLLLIYTREAAYGDPATYLMLAGIISGVAGLCFHHTSNEQKHRPHFPGL